ncbi:uncharacterized protein LOC124937852 [Impatiens glandulifera]|nr:uncharacterized protein LOC124937852 [Impatiens glandulifera]
MKEALIDLAIERPSLQDWKFKEAPDVSFIKSHSNIVKEQDQHWERIEKTIISSVFQKKGELGLKGSAKAAPDKPGAVNNPTKNMPNNPAGAASKATMSNETREALPKALNKLFQTHKHCSFQQICQRLREMAVSESTRPKGMAKEAIAAANGVDAPRSELVEMIGQVAIDIHGVYVPKTSYDHPEYDSFRNVVIGLLIVEGANAKLRKATIMEAAKMQLGRDVTPNEYQMVMNDLCTSSGPIWVLKNSSGSSK